MLTARSGIASLLKRPLTMNSGPSPTVTVPFGESEAVYYGDVAGSAPTGWVSVTVSGGGVSKTAYVYIAE